MVDVYAVIDRLEVRQKELRGRRLGKLGDTWALLKTEEDPEKIKEYQKKINQIESWCIENNFAGIKKLTDWKEWAKKNTKKTYRFEGGRDGGLAIPVGAYIGRDRCKSCQWNKHVWCDRGRTKPCWANV